MHKPPAIVAIMLLTVLTWVSCQYNAPHQYTDKDSINTLHIGRLDQLQSSYITSCDYSALQQMCLLYSAETRTLVEDILHIGKVNDPDINKNLLSFYQDSLLQLVVYDTQDVFADMSDVERELRMAFTRLHTLLPDIPLPAVYSLIGAFQQSIIVTDNSIGICLEKYLGRDYPLYLRYYMPSQRQQMDRSHIVPDLLCFLLLSRYNLSHFETRNQGERDMHIAKIQWVANKCMDKDVFNSPYVKKVDKLMRNSHNKTKIKNLLSDEYTFGNTQ